MTYVYDRETDKTWQYYGDHFLLVSASAAGGSGIMLTDWHRNHSLVVAFRQWQSQPHCFQSRTLTVVCHLPVGHVGDHKNGLLTWENPAPPAPIDPPSSGALLVVQGNVSTGYGFFYRDGFGHWQSIAAQHDATGVAEHARQHGHPAWGIIYHDTRTLVGGYPYSALVDMLHTEKEHYRASTKVVLDGDRVFVHTADHLLWERLPGGDDFIICNDGNPVAPAALHAAIPRRYNGGVTCVISESDSPNDSFVQELRRRRLQAASPALPPKQEEPHPIQCGFCEAEFFPATGVTGAWCSAALCARAGELHEARLSQGGGVDSPETRQETLRYAKAERARRVEVEREEMGARTPLDYYVNHPYPVPYPDTVAAMKPPPEAVPLVGTTPHYEWP